MVIMRVSKKKLTLICLAIFCLVAILEFPAAEGAPRKAKKHHSDDYDGDEEPRPIHNKNKYHEKDHSDDNEDEHGDDDEEEKLKPKPSNGSKNKNGAKKGVDNEKLRALLRDYIAEQPDRIQGRFDSAIDDFVKAIKGIGPGARQFAAKNFGP